MTRETSILRLILTPTKIDWGLARRMQAAHFARVHPNAIQLPDAHKSLLEMADVAAYALAQSKLAALEPHNRKPDNFQTCLITWE
jgi:hypothetical protein